jgi:mono/diheme cytochrome c family protein
VKTPLLLLGLAMGLALLLVAVNSGSRPNPGAEAAAAEAVAVPVPEADAAVGQLVLQRCGSCHGLDTLSHNPQDAAGWARTVALMQQMGAQVAPQERDALVAYLARHFGR